MNNTSNIKEDNNTYNHYSIGDRKLEYKTYLLKLFKSRIDNIIDHIIEFSNLDLKSNAYLPRINLSYSYLIWTNFRIVDVKRTNPTTANFRCANFTYANIRGANLINSKLEGANFRNANLNRANLRYVNLRNTDLKYTNLRGSDLTLADLTLTDLTYAIVGPYDLVGAIRPKTIPSKNYSINYNL